MDLTILYLIIIVAVTVGLVYLAKLLRTRNIVKAEDIIFAMKALELSVEIVDQLNLKNEAKIKNIAEIVIESVQYVSFNLQSKKDKVALAIEYAYAVCKEVNIELTDERKSIIQKLIELSIK